MLARPRAVLVRRGLELEREHGELVPEHVVQFARDAQPLVGPRRDVLEHGGGAQLDVRGGELLAHAPLPLQGERRADARDLEEQVDRRREHRVGGRTPQSDRGAHDDDVDDHDHGGRAHGDDVHAQRGDDDEQDRQPPGARRREDEGPHERDLGRQQRVGAPRREPGAQHDEHGDADERREQGEPEPDRHRHRLGRGDRDHRPDPEHHDEHRDARPRLRIRASHPPTLRRSASGVRCRKSWTEPVTTGTRAAPGHVPSVGDGSRTTAGGEDDGKDVAAVNAVEAQDLTKRYRRKDGVKVAVDGVSLVAAEGEVLGVLGPNGAGKTTTVEMVAGVRRPDGGSVRVAGLDPFVDRAAVRQVLGVQLQSGFLHGALTVRELAHLYRTFYGAGRDPDELVATLGLDEQRDVRYEKLSGGQQQRVAIVLALVGAPRVVILDELTTGLDPQARRQVWGVVERLRDDGVTVLLVSHLMEEVERLCDRVTLLDGGRVVAHDTPAGLVAGAGLDQRVRFRTAEPLAPGVLDAVPGVDGVEVRGEQVVVTGRGDLLQEVSTALVRAGVVATETRLERATLDDAFLALTGRSLVDDTTDVTTEEVA